MKGAYMEGLYNRCQACLTTMSSVAQRHAMLPHVSAGYSNTEPEMQPPTYERRMVKHDTIGQ
jgi:hypothetical protein